MHDYGQLYVEGLGYPLFSFTSDEVLVPVHARQGRDKLAATYAIARCSAFRRAHLRRKLVTGVVHCT
jgi:hypothetical protein